MAPIVHAMPTAAMRAPMTAETPKPHETTRPADVTELAAGDGGLSASSVHSTVTVPLLSHLQKKGKAGATGASQQAGKVGNGEWGHCARQ